MKRSEVVNDKIKFIEDDFAKLKDLKETANTKDILQNSLALYEYVRPVYKTEYTQLAKLYGSNASKQEIEIQAKPIHGKYHAPFIAHYSNLYKLRKNICRAALHQS